MELNALGKVSVGVIAVEMKRGWGLMMSRHTCTGLPSCPILRSPAAFLKTPPPANTDPNKDHLQSSPQLFTLLHHIFMAMSNCCIAGDRSRLRSASVPAVPPPEDLTLLPFSCLVVCILLICYVHTYLP